MCDCRVCLDYREFEKQIALLPASNQHYFRQLYEAMSEAQADGDYHQAIVKNQWPDGDKILAQYRQ